MEPAGELVYQSLELIPGSLRPGAAQLLTNLSVLIQTNPITSSGPDQSHYQPGSAAVALRDLTPVSVHHTPLLLCLIAWTAVGVCVVSPAGYHKGKI